MTVIKINGRQVEVDDLGLHRIIHKDGTKSLPFPNLTRVVDAINGSVQQ